MWKHQGFTFYRPSALTLASTCADAPFSFLQLMLFCVIVYFVRPRSSCVAELRAENLARIQMAGLAPGAGAFFTFYAIVCAGFFALAAFFRLLGTFCKFIGEDKTPLSVADGPL